MAFRLGSGKFKKWIVVGAHRMRPAALINRRSTDKLEEGYLGVGFSCRGVFVCAMQHAGGCDPLLHRSQ